jgi:hypothetical protein
MHIITMIIKKLYMLVRCPIDGFRSPPTATKVIRVLSAGKVIPFKDKGKVIPVLSA